MKLKTVQKRLALGTMTLDRLTAAQRKHVIEWMQDHNSDRWFDADRITELLEDELRNTYGIYDVTNVYWSLSYCQGDGVSIEGSLDFDELRKTHEDLDTLLATIEVACRMHGDIELYEPWCRLHSNHQNHGTAIEFEYQYRLNRFYPGMVAATDPLLDILDEKIEEVKCWTTDFVKHVDRKLQQYGYAEIEYIGGEEYAIECIDSNPDHILSALEDFDEDEED